MPERDELDHLIDSELARYAEPRPGLEQRILARVDAEAIRHPGTISRWRAWVIVGAVVASAILLLVTVPQLVHRQPAMNSATSTSPNHPHPPSSSENPSSKIQVPIRPLPQTAKRTQNAVGSDGTTKQEEKPPVPKLGVFPAPQPLSDQEQALVALATAPSDAARENLIASQHAMNAPLEISAIEIPPITMPVEGNK